MFYFAGPIDAVNDGKTAREVRGFAHEEFARLGSVVFWPQRAYTVGVGDPGREGLEAVQELNNRGLFAAEGVFVDLVSDAERVGTFVELGAAVARGIPVVAVVGDRYRRHLALRQSGVRVFEVGDGSLQSVVGEAVSWLVERVALVGGPVLQWQLDVGAFGGPEIFEAIDRSEVPGVPERQYGGDAGFDLPIPRRVVVPPGEFVDVPSAYRAAPPEGYWLRITGRSSTLRRYGLLVNESVIDGGWRGPLVAGVRNLGSESVVLERGMRVAQVIPQRLDAALIDSRLVSELRPGDRGERGFGSTGK